MTLFKRLRFALKYDIGHEFIVVPVGDNRLAISQFTSFKDAEKFAGEQPLQYGRQSVLVKVKAL